MRSLKILAVCAAAIALPACSGRVAAKPGVGIGVEHRADGGRLGLDLGEYGVDGAAVEPITGNCPGGVCSIPSAPALPTLKVEPRVPAGFLWAAGLFGVSVLGLLAFVVVRKVAK